MGIVSILKRCESFVKRQMLYRVHFNTINEMRAGGTFTKLTKEQEEVVQKFWTKHFGKKINLKWHEYFYRVNKEFSPRYIPTYIYYAHIAPKMNRAVQSAMYSDKNMTDILLGSKIKLPKTYVKNINGIYYIDGEVVSEEMAIAVCQNIADGVIKHSIDTSKGMSVIRFSSKDGNVSCKNPTTIPALFKQYKRDFIVQEAICQSAKMASLNPTSLNTIRIMTYWSENGIVPLFSVVRMGRAGAVVDNASAGGLYCGINMDGSLKKYAYTLAPFTAHTHTDSGIELNNFQIPNFEELKQKAIQLHHYLPYVKLVGWDMTIDQNDEIVLVEANANCPGLFQGATGPAFGEYTEEILKRCAK